MQAPGIENRTSLVHRFIPITMWLPKYERTWLTRDAIAGATLWGLLIPEMIAYAGLAGLPPQAGLYTLLASLVLYAVFGTSRQRAGCLRPDHRGRRGHQPGGRGDRPRRQRRARHHQRRGTRQTGRHAGQARCPVRDRPSPRTSRGDRCEGRVAGRGRRRPRVRQPEHRRSVGHDAARKPPAKRRGEPSSTSAEGRARHPSTGWRCGHGKRLGCRCSGQDLRNAPRRAGCAQRL